MPRYKFQATLGLIPLGIITIAWVCIVGYGLYSLAQENIAREKQRFSNDINSIVSQTKYKLDSNEAVLAGFVAFLQAVEKSDYQATERYAAAAITAYPHIYMMEVARKLPVKEERQFETTLRKEWRTDFTLKNFSDITGRPPTASTHPEHTWPIQFMYPQSAETNQIFGVRLETVDYLWRPLERASEVKAPVVSPVFELYENGKAYIVLQEAIRNYQRVSGEKADFFGNTMVAMLIIKGRSLLPGELETPDFQHTSISAHLDIREAEAAPIFEHVAIQSGSLEKLLLPAFIEHLEVGNLSQPMSLVFERQLRWDDFMNEDFVTKSGLLLFGLIAILWLMLGHRSMFTRLALEHERVAYLATHDQLTDLPNRVLFADRFNQAFHNWQRNSRTFAVFIIDLDHFKEINDTHGHEIGDLVLRTCAQRITKELRSGDTVSRYGGDEFCGL